MSIYRANLMYKDGKDLSADIYRKDINKFVEHVSSSKVYWDDNEKQGFWTKPEQLMYINFVKVEEKKDEPSPKRNTKNKKSVSPKTK